MVFFVGLCATRLLVVGGLLSNFVSTKLADALFDGVGGNELGDDLFCFLINAGSLNGTVDERGSLALVEGEEAFRVLLNLNLGDFEDGLGYLRLVVLCVGSREQKRHEKRVGPKGFGVGIGDSRLLRI